MCLSKFHNDLSPKWPRSSTLYQKRGWYATHWSHKGYGRAACNSSQCQITTRKLWRLLKAVRAVTRKSRYYDTEARNGITKTDCTKSRETQSNQNQLPDGGFIYVLVEWITHTQGRQVLGLLIDFRLFVTRSVHFPSLSPSIFIFCIQVDITYKNTCVGIGCGACVL